MPTCQESTTGAGGSQAPAEASPSQESVQMDDMRKQIQEQAETIKALQENLTSQKTSHQEELKQASQAAAKQAAEQAVASVMEQQRLLTLQQAANPAHQATQKAAELAAQEPKGDEQAAQDQEAEQKAAEQAGREAAQKAAEQAAQEQKAAELAAQEQKEAEEQAAREAAQKAAEQAAQEQKAAEQAAQKQKAAEVAAPQSQEDAQKAAEVAAKQQQKAKDGHGQTVPVVIPPVDPSATGKDGVGVAGAGDSGEDGETKTKEGMGKHADDLKGEKKMDEPEKKGIKGEKSDPMPPPKPPKTSSGIEAFMKSASAPAPKKTIIPKKPPPGRTVGMWAWETTKKT